MVHLDSSRKTHGSRSRIARLIALACAAIAPVVATGCNSSSQGANSTTAKKAEAPKVVKFTYPVVKEVTDYEDFVGTTEAVKTVNITARVTGYLDKINFVDGTEVTEGTELFEIDPRSYKAIMARSEAGVIQSEAHFKRLELDYRRAQGLVNRDVMPREEYDKINGDLAEAAGMLASAKADYDLAKLNYSFTKVTAPISGRLSRRNVDPGNLVSADTTLLTSIVSLDPMYINFDIDERTVLRLRRLIGEEKVKSTAVTTWNVLVGLSDERTDESSEAAQVGQQNYPHMGEVNFSDNHIDVSTGTLRVRAKIDNPIIAKPRTRLLTPGLAVKLRMPIGEPHSSVLVPVNAVGNEQSNRHIFIINDKDVLEQRKVTIGKDLEGMIIVTSGLEPSEKIRIVAEGIQSLQDGKLVKPEPYAAPAQKKPTLAAPKPAVPAPTEHKPS